jgi:hypothetical protein
MAVFACMLRDGAIGEVLRVRPGSAPGQRTHASAATRHTRIHHEQTKRLAETDYEGAKPSDGLRPCVVVLVVFIAFIAFIALSRLPTWDGLCHFGCSTAR